MLSPASFPLDMFHAPGRSVHTQRRVYAEIARHSRDGRTARVKLKRLVKRLGICMKTAWTTVESLRRSGLLTSVRGKQSTYTFAAQVPVLKRYPQPTDELGRFCKMMRRGVRRGLISQAQAEEGIRAKTLAIALRRTKNVLRCA